MAEQDHRVCFDRPLERGRLIKRYKRFLADIEMDDGREMTVHCPNPGAMMGLKEPGLTAWVLDSGNPKRKLSHTLELIEYDGQPVGINTNRPNKIAEKAILAGLVPELTIPAGHTLRREVPYGKNSRIDLLIEPEDGVEGQRCFIEIKNVHLRREDVGNRRIAEFPDSVTSRGAKHLDELIEQHKAGHRAVMLYVIQRMDCDQFGIAGDIDAAYAEAFDRARMAGVEMIAYGCQIDTSGIQLAGPIPVL
ncbi:MAG: DNA/RNA nuclease SfsA [Alphaproteobacteria bacterium]|nr:DNA/RNA nuclease SfsA [Alphaproteobacteria bacterium SS10]